MNDNRRYQRYAVNDDRNTMAQGKIKVEGGIVKLVDFSLGGLCVLSKKPFTLGTKKSISVEFQDGGKIELTGAIVRVDKKLFEWLIAIDLTETYKLNTLRKV